MSTPTPDEITAAIELLRRASGVTDRHTLNDIERLNSPIHRMAEHLHSFWTASAPPNAAIVEEHIRVAAARHGLRITTDPASGELIQYRLVLRAANGWILHDEGSSYTASPGGLGAARVDCAEAADVEGCCPRIAALHLLPEGGQQ